MNRALRALAVLALLALLAGGLARLRFDTDVLALLPADLPTVRALVAQQRHFDSARELFLTLRAEDPEVAEEACRSLAHALRRADGLVRWAVWTPPWEERPDLAAELLAAAWLNEEPGAVRELAARLAPASLPKHLEAVRAGMATSLSPASMAQGGYDPLGLLQVPGLAGQDPSAAPRFASEDGRLRLIIATPGTPFRGYREATAWLDRVRAAVADWQRQHPEWAALVVRYTGGPAFTAEISQGMERDMRGSVLGTAVVIALLFAWAHRRFRPLVLILALLALTLLATLAAGGWIFGRLNAVSLGFAAILLGLAVDYALVLYQEAAAHPEADLATIRREAGRGIVWAAVTTASAFAALALGGLPGLTQLGVLVACGTAIGAAVMLGLFLSPRLIGTPLRRVSQPRLLLPAPAARALTGVLLVVALALLATRGLPSIDPSADPLRPSHSEAYSAMEEMRRLTDENHSEPWWLVAAGPDEAAVARQLRTAESILGTPAGEAGPARHQLPVAFWPDPDRQAANRPILATLARDRDQLREALRTAGFTADAFRAATILLDAWDRAGRERTPFWPTNELSAWTLAQVTARNVGEVPGEKFLALGFLRPSGGAESAAQRDQLRQAGLRVGGWDLLGRELLERVESRLPWVGGLVMLVWLGSLALTFRSTRETLLAVAAVGTGVLFLLAGMAVAGARWNLMNLMALPLLLGAGTDYAIHLQLALRRHRGDLAAVLQTTGKAVFLCVATTVAGFGSLAWSGNQGLASLGILCAAGLTSIYFVSVCLLPAWWRPADGGSVPTPDVPPTAPAPAPIPSRPSTLYRAGAWRLATAVARRIPHPSLAAFAAIVSRTYAALCPERRRVVEQNLLPLLGDDPKAARRAAWRNFDAFGRKLADLWAYEAGRPVASWFTQLDGWDHLEGACASGRGVLLVTPHLGNWEFGAPLLAARGMKLLVITLAEPGDGFTALRQAARARWGIETLVIGQDPFAFVEIIKRLQSGAVVALLLDRPPPPTAVEVRLCGRPFDASIAAAELARASNCVLIPTAIVRTATGYAARVAPPVPYDRRQLGRREARQALTQDILRAFEPWLRQHPDQWFHFVPVWRRPNPSAPGPSLAPAPAPAPSPSSVS